MLHSRWSLIVLSLLFLLWTRGSLATPVDTTTAKPQAPESTPRPSWKDRKFARKPAKGYEENVRIVYRSDKRSPDQIAMAGGFQPRGEYWNDEEAFYIPRHGGFVEGNWEDYDTDDSDMEWEPKKSAYVSTASQAEYASKVNEASNHWIYVIQATPNMIPNNGIEDEILAVGGILWTQVIGWLPWSTSNERLPTADDVRRHMQNNPNYNATRWINSMAAPSLPGDWNHETSMQSAQRFMDRVGGPVGWTGRFPLSFDSYPAPQLEDSDEPWVGRNSSEESDDEPPEKKQKPDTTQPGWWQAEATACVRDEYGGNIDAAFADIFDVLRADGFECPSQTPSAAAGPSEQGPEACVREQYDGDVDAAFADLFDIMRRDGFRIDEVCPSAGLSAVAGPSRVAAPAAAEDHPSWRYLVDQMQILFNIHEGRFIDYLDQGLTWLQQHQPEIYRFLQRTQPHFLEVLGRMLRSGITVSSCFPGRHPFSKRALPEIEAGTGEDQGQTKDHCDLLLSTLEKSDEVATTTSATSVAAHATPTPDNDGDKENKKDDSQATQDNNDKKDNTNDESARIRGEVLKLKESGGNSWVDKVLGGLFGTALAGGVTAFAVTSPEIQALFTGLTTALGITAQAGTAEAVQSAASQVGTRVASQIGSALQRAVGRRLVRLTQRTVNAAVRRIVKAAVQEGRGQAMDEIPLLAYS